MILEKAQLKKFLKSLKDAQLIAPVVDNGSTVFQVVDDMDKAELDLDDYTATIKKAVFPQTETMFTFEQGEGSLSIREPGAISRRVIFGIRPCDAKSYVVLDPLFQKDFDDPYYSARREANVLIGHACAEPTNRCFCPSVGGSPTGTEGLDLLFTDIGDSYFVEVFSDKGKEIAQSAKSVLKKAGADQSAQKEKAAEEAQGKIRRSVDLKMMHEALPKSFSDDFWQTMGNKCIGCGICTYNCPTCHCFDIQDEGVPRSGRRVRVWDACMYPEFTVHASGENPRKNRGDRIRNRMLHKFSYYPQNLGHIGCVGCGRCIEMCPVNEDLIEILTRVREVINE